MSKLMILLKNKHLLPGVVVIAIILGLLWYSRWTYRRLEACRTRAEQCQVDKKSVENSLAQCQSEIVRISTNCDPERYQRICEANCAVLLEEAEEIWRIKLAEADIRARGTTRKLKECEDALALLEGAKTPMEITCPDIATEREEIYVELEEAVLHLEGSTNKPIHAVD